MKDPNAMTVEDTDDNIKWPCACVKRDGRGNLSHIKLHMESTKKCNECGAKRPTEWIKAQRRERLARQGEGGGQ